MTKGLLPPLALSSPGTKRRCDILLLLESCHYCGAISVQTAQRRTGPCTKKITILYATKGNNRARGIVELPRVRGENVQEVSVSL